MLSASDVCICNVNEFISSPVFNSIFSSSVRCSGATVFCIHWCSVPTLIVNYVSYFLFAFAANDSLFFHSSATDLAILCILIQIFFCFSTRKWTEATRDREREKKVFTSKTVTSSTQNVQLCIVWQILAHKTKPNQMLTTRKMKRNIVKMLLA